ncbi:MAG: TRAP transporter large permease subunit [Chloroflexi bacterium]|nr:TRAP transporter large permease subunit [Chloroflexota bacterium]
MEWYVVSAIIVGVLMVCFLSGMPVAFAFLLVNLGGLFFLMGGERALALQVSSAYQSLATFALVPVPLFILMGEITFRSGIGARALDALDRWFGGLPGRLSFIAVLSGTLFGASSGSSMATTAMLGSTLIPDMTRRGYAYVMSLGTISAAGGLAVIIPPTSLGVLLGALTHVSIAKLLIGLVAPGLLMATLYLGYILIRVLLSPELAPRYEVRHVPWREKLLALRHLVPIGVIIFLVTGSMYIGVATPTEAAALGAVGALLLAGAHGELSFKMLRDALLSTLRVTSVVFTIIVGSTAFSQILAFTGASRGLVDLVGGLSAPPAAILAIMMLVIIVLGFFIDQVSSMMITAPVFMPIAQSLGFEPVWFTVLMLLALETGETTPPFGLQLFVLKSVYPKASMQEIILACWPFTVCDFLNLTLNIAFPAIALTLPSLMAR